jgi:hypothetical protein
MNIKLRVGDSVTDLKRYNRVAVESVRGRSFLVGVQNSGRLLALYAVRPGVTSAEVLDGLHAALSCSRPVCVLTNELVEIAADADASRALDEHNDFVAGLNPANEIGKPYTLAASGTDGR